MATFTQEIGNRHGRRHLQVGANKDLLGRYRAHSRIIDLKGQTVIPGIIDSHIHTLWGAFALHGFDLSTPERSIPPDQPGRLIEVIKAYAAAAASQPVDSNKMKCRISDQ